MFARIRESALGMEEIFGIKSSAPASSEAPELFQNLRGLIERGRRHGKRTGRFLLLGSASMDLLKQSGESLAGRIAYLELAPLDGLEVKEGEIDRL